MTTTRGTADLILVHLSDIHFRDDDGGVTGRNNDLRNELERDLRRQLRKVGRYDAVVVTGDIAFSGSPEEFGIASDWLQHLCEEIGCPEENVMPTPGNHDVDRSVINASEEIQGLHNDLRACTPADVTDQLKAIVDRGDGQRLLTPLEAYNAFASQFGCHVNATQHFWERDFFLSDGTCVRVRGLNTACISDELDDARDDRRRLVLGCLQAELKRQDGVEYATLAHHPPDWLRDRDEVERFLNTRSRLQLYGHKHDQVIETVGDGVRVVSGAAHPSRREPNWEPRYNIIALSMTTHRDRSLSIEIRPRRWSRQRTTFVGDPTEDDRFVWEYTFRVTEPGRAATAGHTGRERDRELRRLRYRFRRLAPDLQMKIASDLDLVTHDEFPGATVEFADVVMDRAVERRSLSAMFERVELSHGNKNWDVNPFSTADEGNQT